MSAGWLKQQLDAAAAEVAGWPKWKQQLSADWFNELGDPRWTCVHRSRCDEAQTCAGKPCWKVGEKP